MRALQNNPVRRSPCFSLRRWNRRRGSPAISLISQRFSAAQGGFGDWIKGSVGDRSWHSGFEAVFMPFMLTSDGGLLERAVELLPRPQEKVVMLGKGLMTDQTSCARLRCYVKQRIT